MDNIERGERRTTRRRIHNNVLAGIILLIIGSALLMKKMDYPFPNWLFSWPMILILVGLFIGVVNRFRDIGWLIICGVGFFFLADKIWPSFDVKDFIWPGIIILVGLALLIRPRLSSGNFLWKVKTNSNDDDIDEVETFRPTGKAGKEDIIDAAAVFGAVKKNMYSKTFKGGEIVSVFGGVEIDLSQADFEGKVIIESVQIFGGATLIVPPTWQVRSEAVAIFGGIEDKRKHIVNTAPDRILVLDGFVMFGGIEIKSY